MKKVPAYSLLSRAGNTSFKSPSPVPMDDIFKHPRESQDNYRGFHINDWENMHRLRHLLGDVCPTGAISMVVRDELPDEDGSKPERPVVDYGRCCFLRAVRGYLRHPAR